MQPLSSLNIESELSYAYLHAVASYAGMSCAITNRHEDNNGVDARLTAWGPFKSGGYLDEVDVKVQLKATTQQASLVNGRYSYVLKGVQRYDDLRAVTVDICRILVVLFLPKEAGEWLEHSIDQLIVRRCAYWVSLRNAPSTSNTSGTTVYIPANQLFDVDGLKSLVDRISLRDLPLYVP